MCVCVCKFIKIGYNIFSRRTPVLELPHQIHTHTHTYIYIYLLYKRKSI